MAPLLHEKGDGMKRSFVIKLALMAASVLWYCFAPTPEVLAQSRHFTISPVVRRGDPRLDGGAFFDCDFCEVRIAGERGLNDLSQVVIFGLAGNCGGGIYVVSGRTGFRVADVCQSTPYGRLSLFAGASINNQGQVALNMGPAINNTIVDMILLYSGEQLSKVVGSGDQSPAATRFGSCGFSSPSINNKGEVTFTACFEDDQGFFAGNGVFVYKEGKLHKIATGHDPSPLGGQLALTFGLALPAHINDRGDVLFAAGQIAPDINVPEVFGLFLATANGIKKVELGNDTMPDGSKAAVDSIAMGSLNNKGDVVFSLRLAGKPESGIFLYSAEQTTTIILDGDPTPIGGRFDLRADIDDSTNKINDNATIALMSKVTGGDSPEAIFLASPKAIVKVVAIGDRLPTGETIRSINSFALNNLGQVAFFANGSAKTLKPKPLGVYLATPAAPAITSAKLKRKKGRLELTVNGNALITNDAVIELNGIPLEQMSYPSDFQESGGTTTRIVSRDDRLEELIQSGQAWQVTVFNSLTNLRSAAVTLAR